MKYRNLYAYDIDDYGYAAFICQRYDISDEISAGTKNDVYVIADVYRTINSEGDDVTGITCWHEGMFYDFYFASELTYTRDVTNELQVGDVVRLKVDSSKTIYALTVDFNATKMEKNSSLSASYYENKNGNYSCWFGIPYSSNGVYTLMMTQKDVYGDYLLTKSLFKNFSLKTQNIVRVDLQTKEVRPISVNEIKTYKSFGENAEHMWLVQDCDAPVCVVVFDNYR